MENKSKTPDELVQKIVFWGHEAGEFDYNGVFWPNGLVQVYIAQLNEAELQEPQS